MKTKVLNQMKTKQLGNSDLFITPVGYGSWAIGGAGWQFAWGKQNDDDSIAAIHRALELGVNWIDTAAVYGLGTPKRLWLARWRAGRGRGLMCSPNADSAGTRKAKRIAC
jgi:aryl-alcohol dehydrogenase-like predicted oxidoreductase